MASIEEELKNLVLQIRKETNHGGNTRERVASTFDRLIEFVEEKFINNKSESLTTLGTPTIVDNTFYLSYTGEDGIKQTVSVDLSELTPDIPLPTKTSELINDGSNGVNPFITAKDIPIFVETKTQIEQPTLVGNILTIKYLGESGTLQQQTVDLSNLVTVDVKINSSAYNASTNIITLTDTSGATFNINLSEFSLLVSIDANGVATLTQEGVEKIKISKVGQTGNYNDLINKPDPITSSIENDSSVPGETLNETLEYLHSEVNTPQHDTIVSTEPPTGIANEGTEWIIYK